MYRILAGKAQKDLRAESLLASDWEWLRRRDPRRGGRSETFEVSQDIPVLPLLLLLLLSFGLTGL